MCHIKVTSDKNNHNIVSENLTRHYVNSLHNMLDVYGTNNVISMGGDQTFL